ncbi:MULTISPECIES: ester cyclase [Pseudofrankia]|uniref:ester cyclase n=1 Tax=Pseudofrankia TaxID=2994363 RepID=UPI000234C199|nr:MULTISPECIES: ester cyclase [Pseudofrankia]OHV41340.1 SnoaL-like polyketide cyclase [Pseudofrankia sp. EUN1h]
MSEDGLESTPPHLRGRDAVIAGSEGVVWRDGAPPDYHLSHQVMPLEKSVHHPAGSLSDVVERVVQVFEMELSHKKDPAQWVSTVTDQLQVSVNGGQAVGSAELAERGSYNILIGENPYYSAGDETFESSHDIFHEAFPGGFFWEVLEVYSAPPTITFKWRHWGTFSGPYKGVQPTGDRIEMFGVTVARVSDDLRLVEVHNYYDNTGFLGQLAGGHGS